MSKLNEKASETKPVFVVWSNTDLTEGRGLQIPVRVCWSRTTALRLAKKAGVMGSAAPVREDVAYYINGDWYAPCDIKLPTLEDDKQDERDKKQYTAMQKAKAAGLSDDDIAALRMAR